VNKDYCHNSNPHCFFII